MKQLQSEIVSLRDQNDELTIKLEISRSRESETNLLRAIKSEGNKFPCNFFSLYVLTCYYLFIYFFLYTTFVMHNSIVLLNNFSSQRCRHIRNKYQCRNDFAGRGNCMY